MVTVELVLWMTLLSLKELAVKAALACVYGLLSSVRKGFRLWRHKAWSPCESRKRPHGRRRWLAWPKKALKLHLDPFSTFELQAFAFQTLTPRPLQLFGSCVHLLSSTL